MQQLQAGRGSLQVREHFSRRCEVLSAVWQRAAEGCNAELAPYGKFDRMDTLTSGEGQPI
jgi:hypothetical protein